MRLIPPACLVVATLTLTTPAVADDHTFQFHDAAQIYTLQEPGLPVDAPPIVLVHGWASSRTFWRQQIDVFSESRRVLAVDLPGNGESEDVADEHSMALYADAIAAAMNDAGIEQAVLIGHSNGVPTVREFLRKYPERVVALVAVDGAFENLTPPEQAQQFLAAFEGENYMTFATQVFGSMQANIHKEEDRELVREVMLATSQRVMVGGLRSALTSDLGLDDRITVPLLVINAAQPFWTDEYMERVGKVADVCKVEVWEGVSHFLFMDEPEKFNETVMIWLNEQGC